MSGQIRATILGLGIILLGGSRALAEDPRWPQIVDLRIGFDNQYKLGEWTAVEITLRGGAQQPSGLVGLVMIEVPDGDGTPSRVVTPRPIQVLPGATAKALLYAKIGQTMNELPVEFIVGGRKLAERSFRRYGSNSEPLVPEPLEMGQKLYVTVGPSIGIQVKREDREPAKLVELRDTNQLPTQWYGYEGVDVLVISTSQSEVFAQLASNSAAIEALDKWIEMGGRLILCVGAEARTVFAPGAALARFAPGSLADVVPLRRGAALESYSGSSYRIPPVGRGETINLQVPQFEKIEGVVVVAEGDLPLVIRTPRGFGEITFVGLDLDRRPLANWDGRTKFIDRLLGSAPRTAEGNERQRLRAQAQRLGVSDLAGQLHGALDQFRGIKVVPFWVVGVLIFAYILCIGPGDFLLVKFVLRRMELTWLTFPVMVTLVSLGAYLLAFALKGDKLLVNQIDLVDVETTSGQARGTTWLNVFSPSTSSYNLSLHPRTPGGDDAPREMLLSWLGLPGANGAQALGGQGLFSHTYKYSPALDQLERVPIDVWSTKSFTGRWRTTIKDTIDADLAARSEGKIEGTLVSQLDVPLSDCLLVYDRWAWRLADLEPGKPLVVEPDKRLLIETVLRESKVVKRENNSFVQQAVPFDPASFNVSEILKLMMFHEAGQVGDYTGLPSGYQSFVDQSRQLQLRRAVLVGRITEADWASQLEHNGQPLAGPDDHRWVFYRFLLSVLQTE